MCCDICGKKSDKYFEIESDKGCSNCAKLFAAKIEAEQNNWDKANNILG